MAKYEEHINQIQLNATYVDHREKFNIKPERLCISQNGSLKERVHDEGHMNLVLGCM